jgi:hypothetical protein
MSKLLQCDHCDELVESLDNGWCATCVNAYDGPSDEEQWAGYGASTPQTDAERYDAAANERRRMR